MKYIYYGRSLDDEKLHLMALFLQNQLSNDWEIESHESNHGWIQQNDERNVKYYNNNLKIIKINKANERYFKGRPNCIHVDNFFSITEKVNG